MAPRHDARKTLPVDSQLMLIHADLDELEGIIEKRLDKLDAKMDRLVVVIIGATLSLIVALITALATAITIT